MPAQRHSRNHRRRCHSKIDESPDSIKESTCGYGEVEVDIYPQVALHVHDSSTGTAVRGKRRPPKCLAHAARVRVPMAATDLQSPP